MADDESYHALDKIGPVRFTAVNNNEPNYSASRQFVEDVSTTQVAKDISAIIVDGAYLTLFAQNGDVYYSLADTANATTAQIDPAARTGPAAVNAPRVCQVIPAGTEREFRIPRGKTFLHYMTASGTAVLRGYQSSARRGNGR